MLHALVVLSFVDFCHGEYKFYICNSSYLFFSWIPLENILLVLIPIPSHECQQHLEPGKIQSDMSALSGHTSIFFSDKGKRFPCLFTEYIDESGEGNKTSIPTLQSQS